MRKIAYIELDTHAEIATNYMELSQEFHAVEMDFYLSEKIVRLLPEKLKHKAILCNSETILGMLNRKKYDEVIVGTVHRYFSTFLEITKLFSTSVLVHNACFINLSRVQLFINCWKKEQVYRLKLLLKEGLLSSTKIYQNAKRLLVLDGGIDLISTELNAKKESISLFFYEFFKEKPSKLKVVVPGTVSQQRRDYHRVFSSVKTFKTPMEIVFLGKAMDEELNALKKLNQELPEEISIKFFETKVPDVDFREEMSNASVLWCPLQLHVDFFSQKETYGSSKISGNVGDAIKFGVPAIFPASYKNAYSFIFTEREDVEKQIIDLTNFSEDFSLNFNRRTIAGQLEKVLLSL